MTPAAQTSTVALVVALGDPARREEAAGNLACRLGVDRLLLLVRDPALRVLIPAPGFPQTLRAGPAWRAFIARCTDPGRHEADVEFPPGAKTPAVAIVTGGLALVMLGGRPIETELAAVDTLLPLLRVALDAEQDAMLARSQAVDAAGTASRAHALTSALEGARAEAAKLNVELREEQRRKDDFLAMLAHELRNPLTPLVTAIELLRHKRADGRATDRQLDIMSRQLRQLTRLVEDLLDVSRVSHGRVELRRAPVLLAEVLGDAIEASRPLLEARGHSITLELPAEPLQLNADNVRLTQVFSNLVHNAAKYTDAAGRIAVSAERRGDEAVVRVEDNGVGIAAEMLPRVFDLFTQAPVSLARAEGGLGLGLTLVRSLVDLHGGRVTVHSAGLGCGSTFTVSLPLAERMPAPLEPPASRRPPIPLADQSLRVLIVDDNRDAADSLAEIWRLMGHHPEVAYSGITALQMAGDLEPDLVLLDIGLPELDGYEVARRMRRFLRRDVRFVALTGYGAEEDKRRSREAGFDEHVLKPVSPDALAGIAERAASRAGAAI